MWTSIFSGFGLSLGLIAAIGVQSAYVLRQALQRSYVPLIVTLCILIDSVLIVLGVAGMGTLMEHQPQFVQWIKWAGAIFLFCYGLRAFYAAWKGIGISNTNEPPKQSAGAVIMTVLAISLLNPHAYLDTMVVIGVVGGRYPWPENIGFTVGAILASITWFSAIGFGAKYLNPLFKKPITWRVLDISIGCIMWTIAVSLIAWKG